MQGALEEGRRDLIEIEAQPIGAQPRDRDGQQVMGEGGGA